MKSRLQKSIEYIKGYCDKHDSCSSCRLQDKDGCKLKNTTPCEWEYKAEVGDKDGDIT